MWRQDGPRDEHWTFAYDAYGQLREKELAPPSSDAGWQGARWSYEYGSEVQDAPEGTTCAALGAATAAETGPGGYRTFRWYNAAGKVLCEVRPDLAGISSNRQEVGYAYDGPWVKKQVVREGTSVSTIERPQYDHRGRVLYEVERYEGPESSVGYAYWVDTPWSRRAAEITVRWSANGNTGSRSGRRETDALGNAISQRWGAFGDTWTYDAGGRLRAEQPSGRPEQRYAYEQGYLSTTVLGGVETTSLEYWASGKTRTETGPDGRSRALEWNSRGLLEREEYGRLGVVDTQEYTYDASGNLETRSHGTGSDRTTWTYRYGARGELLGVEQPAGAGGDFRYQYDARGALIGITPPVDGGSAPQTFGYDYLGRQVRRTRGTSAWTTAWASGASTTTEPYDGAHPGQRVVYRVVDGRGRAALERFTGVATDLTEVRTAYDVSDQPLVVNEIRGSGSVDVRFAYTDPRGLLTRIERGSEAVQYGYEASGELSYVTTPSGTVSYGYDGLGRLFEVRSGPETTRLSWEAGGARLLEADDGTRLHECRRYDERGRLRLVRNVDPASGGGCDGTLTDVPLAESAYHYDGRGNRLWEDYRDANTSVQERTEYGYDAADRLTGVRYPGGAAQLYRLGGDGSRMGKKDAPVYAGSLGPAGYGTSSEPEQAHVYDAQGGLTAITDGPGGAALVTYDVDAAGRVRVVTRGGDRSEYTWDAGGRLTAATVRKGGTTNAYGFQYDFSGRRIRRTGPEGVSRYVWGAGELLEEVAPDGGRAVYERGAGMAFGVTRISSGGSVLGRERLLHDGLDSVVGRVGASGVPVLYRYDAWGGFKNGTQPASGEPSLAYAGQHWDDGLGLSYAQQRWYEPSTGRFLSEDPVDGEPLLPNSLMAFGYGNGNPLVFVDPMGTQGVGLDTCSAGGPKCPVPPAPRYPNPLSRVLRDSPTGPQTYNPTPFKPPVAPEPISPGVSRPLWQKVLAWVGIGTTAASTVSGGLELEPGEQERKRKELEELLAHSAELHRKEEECRRGGGDRAWCQAMEFQVPDEQHIKAPGLGSATPTVLPGSDKDAGKVVTDPTTGQPMLAPGTDGAPMLAPGVDKGTDVLRVGGEEQPDRLDPKLIHFMQSSAKNKTGDYTVLGNAAALRSGALKPGDLPAIRVWRDDAGKLWTLDHRRLAAFRLADLKDVAVRWASPEEVAEERWKMTTRTKGESIRLKLEDGSSFTVR